MAGVRREPPAGRLRGAGGELSPSPRRSSADPMLRSKPYDKDDADGQQGAGEPERDECLAPVRAVAHRLEDPDADAPCVERRNERGDASKAERAESRRPGEGAPKHVATGRFKIPAHLLDSEYRHSEPWATPDRGGRGVTRGDLRRNRSSSQSIRSSAKVRREVPGAPEGEDRALRLSPQPSGQGCAARRGRPELRGQAPHPR